MPQRSAASQCIAITKRNMAKILSTLLLPLHSMLGLCSLPALLYALLCFMFCLLHGYLVLGNWAAYQGKAFPNIGCNWKGYPCNHVISTSCNRPPPTPQKKKKNEMLVAFRSNVRGTHLHLVPILFSHPWVSPKIICIHWCRFNLKIGIRCIQNQ